MSSFFRKIQFGKEAPASHGTAVAADTIIAHATIPPVSPDRVVHRPPVNAGVRAESVVGHSYDGQHLWQEPLTIENGYFQILPVLFSMGVLGGVTPAEQTVGEGDMLYDFDPSLTADNALDSISLEFGDDEQAYRVPYVMVNRLRISGDINQGQDASIVQVEADLFGREVEKNAFTGGLSIPTTNLINAKFARIYKDSTWANLGTTEVTNIVRGFDFEMAELAMADFEGSPDRFFTRHNQGLIATRLGLTLARGPDTVAMFDDFRAITTRALRVEIDSGVQIGAGVNHKLTMDIMGTFDPVGQMSEEDRGNLLDVADFVNEYDGTSGKKTRVQVITDVAAI